MNGTDSTGLGRRRKKKSVISHYWDGMGKFLRE